MGGFKGPTTDRVLIKITGLDGSTADMVNPKRSDISKLYNFFEGED